MKNFLKALSSPIFMAFLLVVLIIAMATATFIENDFGTQYARMKVYNAFWFEFLLFMIAINLTLRVFELKLYRPQKLSIFLFHIAFVIMIIGAAVTRYTGIEGTMHIRENQSSSEIITFERNVTIEAKSETESIKEHYASQIDNRKPFKESFSLNNSKYTIELTRYFQNAVPQAVSAPNGDKTIGYIITGHNLRGAEYILNKQINHYQNFNVSFNNSTLTDINLETINGTIYIHSPHTIAVSSMGSDEVVIIENDTVKVEPRLIYRVNHFNFVFQDYNPSAVISPAPAGHSMHSQGMKAMIFSIRQGMHKSEVTLWEHQWGNTPVYTSVNNTDIGISYGNRIIDLPFSLHLDDFVIERYPGSMSPSSFSSYIQIFEEDKAPRPYHIYMNNILKINGYRFFQSSYDQDELGTILSVNHDPWGTGITYFSYFLLIVGMLWSLINPASYFRKTVVKDKSFLVLIILCSILPVSSFAQNKNKIAFDAVERKHAEEFSKIKVQNNRGRTEPIHTFASAITRKLARKESLHGLTPAQLFLEMNMDPQKWIEIPLIRVKNNDLRDYLGITGSYASYIDFVTHEYGYILQEHVQTAYAKPAAQRTKFDKEIIKTDEKVNICYGIFTGDYLRIFPVPGNPDSTTWYTAHNATKVAVSKPDSMFFDTILTRYFEALQNAKSEGNYTKANELLETIKLHQQQYAAYNLHSPTRIETEIIYNKINPFKKLFPFYLALGIIHLIVLITFITIGKKPSIFVNRIFFYTILAGFILHTLGIAARWYISGYAPMSNGYETMVFIAWVTVLAGFIFNKNSSFSLTATSVVAGLTLMVANLNFMDPVITNLVPVLQSYWLTIHVSVITAGYGFLALGAILGIINLILVTLRSGKNHKRIADTIVELTVINQKSLIVGLYFLTIGSFLGAVWANESWGRYWGWDPKETWALISILVYTIITHARLIPGIKGFFVFNTLSLWGFSSIIMTFFGVNYYLSGLHSYAGGDPVPVPSFVYYTVFIFIVLTVGAWYNYNKFKVAEKSTNDIEVND